MNDEPTVVFAGGVGPERALLVGVLEGQGFRVHVGSGVEDGRALLDVTRPDVALVDTRFADGDPLELIDHLFGAGIPTAVVGSHAERDWVAGTPGASAFFVRPVVAASLVTTVRSLIRRHRLATAGPVLRFDPLVIDVVGRSVTVGERPVHFTPKEFDVLADLAGSAGRTRPVEELLRDVWHAEPGERDARTVAVHVRRIRQKLEAAGLGPCIRTVRGEGYVFVPS